MAVISGCAQDEDQSTPTSAAATAVEAVRSRGATSVVSLSDPTASGPAKPEILKGTGQLINRKAAAPPPVTVTPRGNVILNFAGASIGEVVRSVLGTTLKLNYVLHPAVKGKVTVQTSRPLPRSAVLPALENILRVHGAAIVEAGGVYNVVPVEEAASGGVRPRISAGQRIAQRGFGVEIVPLKFVSVGEMERILKPFAPPSGILQVDRNRNLLLLAGTRRELENMIDIVDIFDVDWLSGMSIGLFPLQFTEAAALIDDLQKVFGNQAEGPLAGVLRFVPVERLNAVLAISPQPAYLDTAKEWIERFDKGTDGGDKRLHVYRVQNGRAAELADVLSRIFLPEGGAAAAPETKLAPGRTPTRISSTRSTDRRTSSLTGARSQTGQRPTTSGRRSSASSPTRPGAATAASRRLSASGAGRVKPLARPADFGSIRIIADEQKNALVILATPKDFRMIAAAIRQLDVPPLQVLVEATIAEVTLKDELKYGLQWFFQSGNSSVALSNVASGAVASAFPGFSYVLSGGNARVVLDALASITDVNIVSSPQLMVLDNQSAQLQVGDEVPVTTQRTSSVTDPDAPLVSTIQFRNTGVILNVTPRVNEGGLIMMEVEQEVSSVAPSTVDGNLTPTIQQRRIRTTVAVQSGETVALGGLIQDSKNKARTGLPFLSSIPILGALFGTTTDNDNRTELLVLITPRIVRDQREARLVTDELRRRIKNVEALVRKVR